jgi:integrase
VRVPQGQEHDEGDRRPKALTRAELAALLAELPEGWRPFSELLVHSGMRISASRCLRLLASRVRLVDGKPARSCRPASRLLRQRDSMRTGHRLG